jgi:hypothetical protein
VTILHTGGYATPHAVLTMAIAAGVGIGALCIGKAWSEKRRGLALAIGVALICGELFGLLMTGERLVASREAAQAPLRAANDAIAQAAERVRQAEVALRAVPTTSPRLTAAMTAKAKADETVASKASERSCAVNCRQLLQAQVDEAQREVNAARLANDSARSRAEATLSAARADLSSLKPPGSASPLADRLGLPGWTLDLLAAALGSIAANGLGCCLLAFGAHGRGHAPANAAPVVKSMQQPEPIIEMEPVKEAPPPVVNTAPPARLQLVGPTASVSKFVVHSLEPDRRGRVEITDLYRAYRTWARDNGQAPLAPAEFGERLATIFEKTGIETEQEADRVFCLGAKLVA